MIPTLNEAFTFKCVYIYVSTCNNHRVVINLHDSFFDKLRTVAANNLHKVTQMVTEVNASNAYETSLTFVLGLLTSLMWN